MFVKTQLVKLAVVSHVPSVDHGSANNVNQSFENMLDGFDRDCY